MPASTHTSTNGGISRTVLEKEPTMASHGNPDGTATFSSYSEVSLRGHNFHIRAINM
ncbi:hypothetical protein BABINDRAFT_161719 [Babjeviella inositovora NRRL Y-12698]|uniref:Uncharacterized protein n=1 Tax=Babjeviella inositovora NRRL Y-12698 TaxID=984486 RepID=A0A1E3QNM0_9ASCO|nr:uncharacterized protein BABINDRAFT_161719 [Babjeviella inositovora NRRL Y-12698]ODQ79306.1 hypothetical protein BABINDRAFT_161719 [Babjeviella inositovora NRRL Y-12698]